LVWNEVDLDSSPALGRCFLHDQGVVTVSRYTPRTLKYDQDRCVVQGPARSVLPVPTCLHEGRPRQSRRAGSGVGWAHEDVNL